jgi:hypothetical protein
MHKDINTAAIILVPEKEKGCPIFNKKRLPDKGAIRKDNCFPSDRSMNKIVTETA